MMTCLVSKVVGLIIVQDYVDQFNNPLEMNKMVFLLSAQAGGVGLNLVGASQLVLLDPHWCVV